MCCSVCHPLPGVQVLSHPDTLLLAVPQQEQFLDAHHTNTQPRPETLPVAAQPGEQGLHGGPHPHHQTSGQARGQPAGAKSSHAPGCEVLTLGLLQCEENVSWTNSANSALSPREQQEEISLLPLPLPPRSTLQTLGRETVWDLGERYIDEMFIKLETWKMPIYLCSSEIF